MAYKTQRHKEIRKGVSELGLFLKTNSTFFFFFNICLFIGLCRVLVGSHVIISFSGTTTWKHNGDFSHGSKLLAAACGI